MSQPETFPKANRQNGSLTREATVSLSAKEAARFARLGALQASDARKLLPSIIAHGQSRALTYLCARTAAYDSPAIFQLQLAPERIRSCSALRSQEREGSRARYRQADIDMKVPEGVSAVVTYKGEVATPVYYLAGGLRAGMGYVGARTIPELIQNADFYRITNAGMAKSEPHDVTMLSESPTFRRSGA